MSLEEAKRLNAEEEAQEQEAPNLETESLEAAEEPEVEEEESEGSDESSETEEEAVEAWLHSDDQTSQESETVPLSDLIGMRTKLKGKLHDKNDRIAELEAKIESLQAAPQQPMATGKPKRDDFLTSDDPEEAYIDALAEWKAEEAKKQSQAAAQLEQQRAFAERVEKGVQGHLERASKLLSDNGLSAEVYESAHSGVRDSIESVFPGHGSDTLDLLITQIGEGSEKLIMYVGNNASRRDQLRAAFTEDPNGLKAMRLIGKWETEMTAPQKRISKAPKPAVQVRAGESVDVAAGLRKKIDDALKKGNAQKAYDLKRQARQQGINIS